MKSRFWIVALLSLFATSLFFPQAISQAATVTYTTCPDFSTLETDASSAGTITFNIASPCDVEFDNEITISGYTLTITNIGDEVVFDGDGEEYHFDIYPDGNLTLNNLVLYNGYSDLGGSIYNEGVLTVTNSVFDYNYAYDYGGAIYNCCGTMTLTNTLFVDNEAGYEGGAIINNGGTITITGGAFESNSTEEYAGAIGNAGTLIISDVYFEGNTAEFEEGGAIFHPEGTLTISGSTFDNNNSGADGGAINIEDGIVTISGSLFIGNESYDDDGGAVNIDGGVVTIFSSSFVGNSAYDEGGAISNDYATTTITNSTFYNNQSDDNGGAIINEETGTLSLIHVTMVSNTSDSDGDNIWMDNSMTTVTASIIAGGDCYVSSGSFIDGGNNIQYLALGCFGTDTDPMLGAFAGGVFVPADGSPAIDAMPACILATDQLGTARPQGLGCDIGAIEGGGGFVVPIPVTPTGPEVLGCVFDTPSGMELSNVPDNTYCTVLMKNGEVINYSGAVPAELIGLGVIFAVDVYRLEGGRSVVEFPNYGRICLRGNGRMFYMDARNAPRYPIEMTTERVDGLTCAWIPATGTLILTNN